MATKPDDAKTCPLPVQRTDAALSEMRQLQYPIPYPEINNPNGPMPRLNPSWFVPNRNLIGGRPCHNPSPKGTFTNKFMLVRHRGGKITTVIGRRAYGRQDFAVVRMTRTNQALFKMTRGESHCCRIKLPVWGPQR